MSKTKVDIVSGFLGAGKTTFIKKLLGEALKDEQIVLIENEFGEIGIDGGFLKDSGVEIREMSQGCICCSLVGDFAASLKEILTNYKPDRIIIEPSGVGKLSDVMKAIAGVEEELGVESNSAITLVDCRKANLYHKNFGEFFNNQIQYASTIVLSRTDIADKDQVDKAVEVIREINPTATIITTSIDLLSGAVLLEILESPVDLKAEMLAAEPDGEDPEEHEHHHHHHHHDHDDDEHEHHHHHDDDDDECEHCHHDDDDDDEHEHHHHHDDDDEHEHCHHDHDDEHEHHHDHEHEHHHEHHGHHHHHADEVFESWGKENVGGMSEDSLKAILEGFDEHIIRAKGMIASENANDWLYFDMVPGQIEIRHGEPYATGKVCVIGEHIDEDKLAELFK